ncbi:hypothetical protein RHSIM_Rhsim13G0206300 [Rhododendron simsii]|uniref:Uncharacterized protein n=1 Tax=Rhododendron simsii TaxID=118357 RepID=A0A834G1I6_RHOSS|nr:hypothetical protein RHSIM_Rhsim13G0206300 [Rhododendron simsii]
METSQACNGSSIYVVSAPSSPSRFSSPNNNMVHFYSAQTSPRQMGAVLEEENTNFDDFEFETSKRFRQDGYSEFEKRPTFDTLVPMAFADELFSNGQVVPFSNGQVVPFSNGQVVPLKPPPRLSYYSSPNGTSNRSSSSAASSPNPVLKIPFPRWKNTWSDEFDPFAVALEKVTEEKREKSHHHRRSRSLSPFRTTNAPPELQDQNKQGGPPSLELIKHHMGPNCPQENDPQKSSQMVVISPISGPPNKHKGYYLPFGKKVRPMKVGHEGTMKAVEEEETTESSGGENREQKGKGFLGRENNEVKAMKEQVAALWKRLRSLSEPPKKKEIRKKLSSK